MFNFTHEFCHLKLRSVPNLMRITCNINYNKFKLVLNIVCNQVYRFFKFMHEGLNMALQPLPNWLHLHFNNNYINVIWSSTIWFELPLLGCRSLLNQLHLACNFMHVWFTLALRSLPNWLHIFAASTKWTSPDLQTVTKLITPSR